jgi:hypothetical protein
VKNFLRIKPPRCTNFANLFWNETLHVSDSFSVHHQEFSSSGVITPDYGQRNCPKLVVGVITPDDGQRNCPKLVVFHSKINLRS